MRILITGAGGQLGFDLIRVLASKHKLWAMTKNDLNVTDGDQVIKTVDRLKPDVIIHAAAFTNVDQAEVLQEEAYHVNAFGTRNIAIAANQLRTKVVYISTDYVFDGSIGRPYTELDTPSPLGVYGSSKYLGEKWIESFSDQYFILRTAWLFGIHGNNLVKTIYNTTKKQETITAVTDQVGSPTYSLDLAYFISQIILTEKYGVYHVSNKGYCTKYEFIQAVLELINRKDVRLIKAELKQFNLKAPRPMYSALDDLGRRLNHLPEMRDWKSALKSFVLKEWMSKSE